MKKTSIIIRISIISYIAFLISGLTVIILLSPELGDYKVVNHPSFDFKEGDYIEFFCPICHVQLTSEKNENLAKVIMIDEDLKESEILFSKIAGEMCTYRMVDGNVEEYGKDSATYLEYLIPMPPDS